MEAKHTKGKWSIKNHSENNKWFNIQDKYKEVIARTFYGDSPPPIIMQEAKANAQLIAHAPEMLEMLIEFVIMFDGVLNENTKSDELHKKAKQLITKATTI